MGKTAFVLLVANVAVIATWLILRAVWFDGGIGCDDGAGPDYDTCNDRADLLVALGLTAITLFAGTLLTFAAHGAGRLRARRSSPR